MSIHSSGAPQRSSRSVRPEIKAECQQCQAQYRLPQFFAEYDASVPDTLFNPAQRKKTVRRSPSGSTNMSFTQKCFHAEESVLFIL